MHPSWSRPSRSLAAPAWLSVAAPGFNPGVVQDVRGLVHPAALSARLGPHFLDCLPEAERAVGDGELGRCRKSAPLQVEQQLPPGLRTLAYTVDQADQLFLALERGADDDQQALRG